MIREEMKKGYILAVKVYFAVAVAAFASLKVHNLKVRIERTYCIEI